MKISKKKALQFAVKEYLVRYGWEDDTPGWTVEDEVKQEGRVEDWYRSPDGLLATMFFDYSFGTGNLTKAKIKQLRRFYGARLWDAAIVCLLNRDHDT